MPLTPEDTRLLTETFLLLPEVEEVSVAFYERLFLRAPQLRPMFRDDIANQGMRFMTAVRTIVGRLEARGEAADHLARLGRDHAALGVRPEHFEPMREALIETFRATLGDAFTPAAEVAWCRAYDEIAAAMIAEGKP